MSSRRSFLASSAILLTPAQLLAEVLRAPKSQSTSRPWLAAALKAEKWLAASAQRDANGINWPADPTNPKSTSPDLYNGMAGVVLFYLELHNATGDNHALQMAKGGADFLLASVPDEPGNRPMGLYSGLAGTAIVLAHAFDATKDRRYEAG